ncbi:MAG TPA: hypothetical protein PKL84_11735 [Candidatus Hydrogenedentes bacterium]|nr:hypothetical protein [Candidatus Hydrogenedentota bacterium]
MERKKCFGWCVLCALGVVALLSTSAAANSTTVSYQGVLRDATMTPVPDGAYPMRFSIWDDPAAGNKRWGDEDHPVVPTKNGMFSVYLGSTLSLAGVFAMHSSLWLQIEADTGAGLEVYSPRVPLASVPYAQDAQNGSLIGEIICVYIGLPGVPSIADYQSRGWALCNGTTPAAQGIVGSPITVALPNLNGQGLFLRGGATAGTIQGHSVGPHSHPASFSGGNAASAGAHEHSVSGTTSTIGNHTHTQYVTANPGAGPYNTRADYNSDNNNLQRYPQVETSAAGSHNHTFNVTSGSAGAHEHLVSGTVTVNNNTGTTETRPVNMSVVYFMKVR